jgi:hypothetical protein
LLGAAPRRGVVTAGCLARVSICAADAFVGLDHVPGRDDSPHAGGGTHAAFPWLLAGQAGSPVGGLEVLFETREVLEVVLEAIPTAVLQSVVFVAGNRPSLGIYLDETLYLLSSGGSCVQILRLTALILWAAARQHKSVWRVLSDRMSVNSICMQNSADKLLLPDI